MAHLRIQASILIDKPVEQVFDFVRRFENVPLWVPAIRHARQVSEGPMGVGTEGVEFVGPFGQGAEVRWKITQYEPNRRCSFRSQSRFFFSELRTDSIYSFESSQGGTKLDVLIETDATGLVEVIRPFFRYVTQRNRESLLRNIKARLESGPAI